MTREDERTSARYSTGHPREESSGEYLVSQLRLASRDVSDISEVRERVGVPRIVFDEGKLRAAANTNVVYAEEAALALFGRGLDTEWRLRGELKRARQQLEDLRLELSRAEKMADLGVVASSVAHDLKTPLNAIRVATQYCSRLMREESLDLLEQQDGLRDIDQLVSDMEDIIEEIHAFARTSGQFQWEELNVDQEIRRALTLIQPEFDALGISARVELGARRAARGQAGKVQQVVVNLLQNARDAFITAGRLGPAAGVWLTSSIDSRGSIVVMVRDNAGGVPASIRDRIFDAFFTTKGVGHGVGLGLAICQRTIAGLGGQLGLQVQDGVGSSFVFNLLPWHDNQHD